MQGYKRRVVYVGIYEAIAIAVCSVSFAAASESSLKSTAILSVVTSAIAMIRNWLYTTLFEAWESRQRKRGRSIKRRIGHAIGFEGGLLMLLVPLSAWWLYLSLFQALMMNLGLAAFFLGYTVVFNWAFDYVFGLPMSARV